MNAGEKLARIIEREADKLAIESDGSEYPLPPENIERLEVLARCVRALRGAEPAKAAAADDDADTADLIEMAK